MPPSLTITLSFSLTNIINDDIYSPRPCLYDFVGSESGQKHSVVWAGLKIQTTKWMYLQSLKSVKQHVANSVNRSILKKSWHIGFDVFIVHSSVRLNHRVGRVLSFFSSRRDWDSPNPSSAGECAPPPPVPGGGAHSLAREGMGESQFRLGDIHCGTLYISVLCGLNISKDCVVCRPRRCGDVHWTFTSRGWWWRWSTTVSASTPRTSAPTSTSPTLCPASPRLSPASSLSQVIKTCSAGKK